MVEFEGLASFVEFADLFLQFAVVEFQGLALLDGFR